MITMRFSDEWSSCDLLTFHVENESENTNCDNARNEGNVMVGSNEHLPSF